jgi:hypothetical protein
VDRSIGASHYTLLASVSFYSNEHPFQSPGFNDFWQIGVRDPGQEGTTILKQDNRNDGGVFVFGSSATNTSTAPASAAGFATNGPSPYGVTGFRDFSLSWIPTESGTGDVFFRISDVGDTAVDSAILFDSVALLEDPPLFLLQAGDTLTRTTSDRCSADRTPCDLRSAPRDRRAGGRAWPARCSARPIAI